MLLVALRKESVDRNFCHEIQAYTCTGSLSARRAWIEIAILGIGFLLALCRSPQGERG